MFIDKSKNNSGEIEDIVEAHICKLRTHDTSIEYTTRTGFMSICRIYIPYTRTAVCVTVFENMDFL